MICYEHPLNERIRTLLRLEDLFNKIDAFAAKDDAIEHHALLITLFEVIEITNRADIKSDLLQELDRQKQALEVLKRNPNVSEAALNETLDNIQTTFRDILDLPSKVGHHLRANEWLMSIKQRVGVPGGMCEFDLPAYHYWLQSSPEQRHQDLNTWLQPFTPIRSAFDIVLYILRNSGKTLEFTAEKGILQYPGSEYMAHMLRLHIDQNLPCTPEISANKYALNIRFVPLNATQRTLLYERDVPFQLTFCNL